MEGILRQVIVVRRFLLNISNLHYLRLCRQSHRRQIRQCSRVDIRLQIFVNTGGHQAEYKLQETHLDHGHHRRIDFRRLVSNKSVMFWRSMKLQGQGDEPNYHDKQHHLWGPPISREHRRFLRPLRSNISPWIRHGRPEAVTGDLDFRGTTIHYQRRVDPVWRAMCTPCSIQRTLANGQKKTTKFSKIASENGFNNLFSLSHPHFASQ